MLSGWRWDPFPEWFGSWWVVAVVVATIVLSSWWLFRSLRRWRHPPPRSPEQVQAEMWLFGESRQTDRW